MLRQSLFLGAAVGAVILAAAAPSAAATVSVRQILLGRPAATIIIPVLPGVLDEFDWNVTAGTNVAGHQPTAGGPAWTLENAASPGTIKTLQLDGSGHLTMGANATFNTEEYLTLTGSPTNILVVTRENPNAAAAITTAMWGHAADFLHITGSGTSDAIQATYNSVVRFNFRTGAGNATETNKAQINGTSAFAGDGLDRRYFKVSTSWFLQYGLNGDWLDDPVDITAWGPDYTQLNFGFLGNGGITSGATNVSLIDHYELTDLGAQSNLLLRLHQKVAALSANGSLTQHLVGQYWGVAPTSANFTLCYYDSTQTAISGKCPATFTNFTASGGTFSLDGPTFASGSLPGSNFVVKVSRTDTTPAMLSYSGTLTPGGQYAGTGQSLWINAILNGAASVGTTGLTNMYQWDGSSCKGSGVCLESTGVTSRKRLSRIPDNSAASAMAAIWEANNGSKPFSLVNCGQGGTNIVQRIPGASFVALPATNGAQQNIFDNCVDTLTNQTGKELRGLFIADGEFDVSGSDFTNYDANQLLIIRGIKAAIGHDFNVCLRPVTSYNTTSNSQDAQWEAQRRQQHKFILDNSAGDSTTPPVVDCGMSGAEDHGDPFHPTGLGFGNMYRRMMWNELYAETGTASLAHFGPKLVSLSFTSSTHISVVVTADAGATAVDVRNKVANTTDLAGGGLWFHNSSSFARLTSGLTQTLDHVPTAISCTNTSGTTWTCDETFAGGTWTTGDHAYLSGPWGAEPFNPRHDTTQRGSESTKDSILEETFADGSTAQVQPYWDYAGGNDYLVSSNTCP